MAFTRTTTINAAPGGDSTKQAVLDLDTDLTGAFTHLNTLDTTKLASATAGTTYAPIAKGVTNGDSHDHSGGDGAQIAYSSLSGTPDPSDYAPAAKGVTNGDSHDHSGGDGGTIAYSSLSGIDGDKGDITVSGSGATWTIDNASVTNAKLAFDGGALSGFRNVIINGNFNVNQRVYYSGLAVGSGLYGHDRWKMAANVDIYTFSTTANVTTVTIPAGKVLRQVIEGNNLQSGTYVLSWTGTAQGKIGAGSYGASGITGTATGGTDLTIEFGPGTVSKVQFEFGSTPTPFEARPYGVELALCQRYLPVIENQHGVLTGHCFSTTSAILHATFPVTARVAPTGITYANIIAWSVRSSAGDAVQLATLTFSTASKGHAQLSCTVASGLVAGDGTSSYNNGGAGYLYFTGCEL